jgi:integrase/recombinase XerD
MQLSKAIDALCLATKVAGRSPRTVDSYRQKLGALVGFLGDVPVETITTDDLRRFIAHLLDRATLYPDHPLHEERAGQLSPFTIQSHVRAVKRLFNWLEAEGKITGNPMRRIAVPRPRRREPKGISVADLRALLRTTEGGSLIDLRDRAMMLVLADTGCRVGGLVGLQVGDVDLEMGLATVTEKRAKTRLVPFTETTADALGAWLDVRPQDKGPWMFVGLGTHSQRALTTNGVVQAFRRRARRAGITGPVNPHAFRHAFARFFLLDGGDLATLSELLGHETVDVTKDFYAIFTVRELQEKHRRHSPVRGLLGGDEDG